MDGISGTVQIFSGGEKAERETTQLRPIDKRETKDTQDDDNQRQRTITVQ